MSLFDEREQKAWGLIVDAMVAIQDLDERSRLSANTAELAQAIHVLQGYVKQHVLWRLDPDEFSDWWEPEDVRMRRFLGYPETKAAFTG